MSQTLSSMQPGCKSRLTRPPFFLIGSVRSGTTMLRLMLDHHPQLACHFEFEYAVEQMTSSGQVPDADQYREYLRQNRIFKLSKFKIDESLSYRELVESFLIQKQKLDSQSIVGATIHYNFDRVRLLWPKARFIYIVRDGRDVAYSCLRQGWAGNFYTAVDFWMQAETTLKRLKKVISEDQLLEVRFENLVSNPESTLGEICGFLGVDFSAAMLDYSQFSTYAAPDATAAHRWTEFSDRDIGLAESRIGPMLAARGYELSNVPPIAVGWLRRRMLLADDRWRKFVGRVERFGYGLVVADLVARHAHLKKWAKRCHERMDAIINQQLD